MYDPDWVLNLDYIVCVALKSPGKKKTEEDKKELQEVTESLAAAKEINLNSPGAAVLSTLEHLHYKKNIKWDPF